MKYGTIVADPPWKVLRPAGGTWTGGQGGNRPQPYPTMTVDEIAALQVAELAAMPSHLYLWTVNRYVADAYDVARAWGFVPSTLLVWAKPPMGSGPGGLFSITTEFVLYAKRGTENRHSVIPTSWFSWPRRAQSQKPEAFFDLVEQISPPPRLELFARRQRLGWDTWGNEALNHVEISA